MNQFKTDIDYNSEIDKFKNSIIYFDWNILTQLWILMTFVKLFYPKLTKQGKMPIRKVMFT